MRLEEGRTVECSNEVNPLLKGIAIGLCFEGSIGTIIGILSEYKSFGLASLAVGIVGAGLYGLAALRADREYIE